MNKTSGSYGMSILFACVILAKYLLIVPEYMVKYVGNCAWIDICAKCVMAIVSLSIALFLYKPFAPMSFSSLTTLACGKFAGAVIRGIYIVAFTLFNSFLLRLLAEALSTVMATDAPDEFFALFILVAVFAAAESGINPTVNLCCIIFPLVLISLFTVCGALFGHYRISNIMPVFGLGKKTLLSGIFLKHFGFAETSLLFFLAPSMKNYGEIKKTAVLTYFVITLFTVIFTAAYCLCVPYPSSAKFFLPFYQMTRMIKSGAFLQRLEPIAVFVWTSFIMCSMSVLIAVTAKLLSQSPTGFKERAFIPALTVITFLIALIPSGEATAFSFYEKLLGASTLLFPIIPVCVFIIARIRKVRNTEQ